MNERMRSTSYLSDVEEVAFQSRQIKRLRDEIAQAHERRAAALSRLGHSGASDAFLNELVEVTR